MTEKEAIKLINSAIIESERAIIQLSEVKELAERKNKVGEYYANIQKGKDEIESCKVAIQALEEIQKYKEIGTVEEIKGKIDELKQWHTEHTVKGIKNVFANTSTLICHNCDHKDEYIEELEFEIGEYKVIGTVENFRKAKRFKEYFDELYGTGLDVANWHQNGTTEPFDNFYDAAIDWSEE